MMPEGCITPGALTPEDLLAWAEDEADLTVHAHVDHCPACRSQALRYLAVQRRLAAALLRADCPASMTLAEYAVDLLSPEERTAVTVHVFSCGRCTEELATLRRDLAEPAVPAAATTSLLERLTTIIATLVPPPAPQPGMAGALRGTVSTAQPRTYVADDVQITVTLSAEAGDACMALQGLVLSAAHATELLRRTRVDLLLDADIVATADLDEFGSFSLAGVPAGECLLQVSFPDRAVVIPAFSLQS